MSCIIINLVPYIFFQLHFKSHFSFVLSYQDGKVDANRNRITTSVSAPRAAVDQEDDDEDDDDEDDDIEEQEITIRFVRKNGTGLGISIAGGVGSTAYRDDDDVLTIYLFI